MRKCNKKNNICNKQWKVKNQKKKKWEEYGEVKSLKLRFHPNNTRNEAMICFSTEEEAQLAITEINTYKGWRAELYKPIRKSREFERETEKPDNSNKEHEQRRNNESSTKQVELSHLKEEIKYIKRTLDILLERQWLETPKDNEEGSTETKKIRKSNRSKSKNTKNALKNFKIYYQNVRGLKSKLDSLQEMIDDYQPALVCIVETHMQKEEEIQIPGYSLV